MLEIKNKMYCYIYLVIGNILVINIHYKSCLLKIDLNKLNRPQVL